MISRAKKYVAVLLAFVCVCMIFSPQTVYAAEDSSQHETVKVGFFAMDGYHVMDEEGNRSGYGYDFLRLMARYWDVDYEYVGYDKSWDDMQQMLEDGEIDMVTSPRKTPEREEKFDFSRPIGTNNGILTVRSDNSTIVDGNYSTYNGMRVALLNGSSRDKELADFAGNKGFTYDPFYFDTTEEMEEALQSGNVDAIAATSLRKTNNERIVDKFDSSDFYVMVKKGNTELLNEINYAIDQMNAVEGDWKTTLYNKNYESIETKNLEYTEKEKSIISQYSKDNPLHVLCDPTRYPYSYNENGEMKGIIPDYFRKIADYAGISYEFLTPATRDEYIAYQKNKETTDMSIDARLETDNYAETKKWGITAPFITMQLARVTRRDFDGKINVVATVDQTASNSIEDAMAPGAEKLMCSTRQEMMEAVRKGKADAAFVYYYMAQAFVNSDTTGTMTYTLLEQPTFTYRMVISSTENHALAGILTKAMYAMPQNLVEDLAAQYTTYKATELTFVDWIRLHPVVTVWVLLIFGWLLTTMAVTMVRLSARKKAQKAAQEKAEEMAELAEHAQAANKAKTEFLSNMSHDIRTPMNAIVGLTAIAGANIESQDRVIECLSKITESSRHLLGLINEVLDMARIESGKMTLAQEDFNLAELVDNLITLMKPMLDEHKHNFDIHINRIEHEAVCGDSLRIQQVFVNLMSNAIKYTPDGGNIIFSIEEKPNGFSELGCYEFTIEDNGIGMSPEFQKIMFDPFSRADDHRTTRIQGTGLGMAISRNIVNLMNGTIKVDSTLHKGTKITVTIYLELQEKEKEQDKNLMNLPVLVVDDDKTCCESTVATLKEIGIMGEWVLSGREAVERCYARHELKDDYFAVILDWKMPDMDGIETARQIRKRIGKEITIIVLTSYEFSEIEEEAKAAGVDAFIAKPLFRSRLTATLRQFTSGRKENTARNDLEKLSEADYTGKRILLVEDNELNREIGVEILQMTGAEVETAENGKIAVEKVEASPKGSYDLIFMDIQMPVMNGYEATAAIRSLPGEKGKLPIVAMTANAFAEDVQLAKNTGMNGHIAKPLDMNKLNDVLENWL